MITNRGPGVDRADIDEMWGWVITAERGEGVMYKEGVASIQRSMEGSWGVCRKVIGVNVIHAIA